MHYFSLSAFVVVESVHSVTVSFRTCSVSIVRDVRACVLLYASCLIRRSCCAFWVYAIYVHGLYVLDVLLAI